MYIHIYIYIYLFIYFYSNLPRERVRPEKQGPTNLSPKRRDYSGYRAGGKGPRLYLREAPPSPPAPRSRLGQKNRMNHIQ